MRVLCQYKVELIAFMAFLLPLVFLSKHFRLQLTIRGIYSEYERYSSIIIVANLTATGQWNNYVHWLCWL